MSEGGYDTEYSNNEYLEAYEQICLEVYRPLEKIVEKADLDSFRPKFKHHHPRKWQSREDDDDDWRDLLNYSPNEEDGEEEEEEEGLYREKQKTFFSPPLQIQRNSFVKKTLAEFRQQTCDLSKMCIMGCGEMSLEKYLISEFSHFGTKMVLSVDFDETSLSIGQQLIEKALEEQKWHIEHNKGIPILMRSYYGNILDVDNRFGNADAIVSLEVIEHMPLEEAVQFVRNVLGNLRPRIFIFSTPNHDYNQVFGDAPGTFRHDDHKFEMSAEEFATWINDLRGEFQDYLIEGPVYIGIGEGYEDLKGATQAAICRLNCDISSDIPVLQTPYSTVGQIMIPVGVRSMMFRLLKEAFLEWLQTAVFREAELHESGFLKYWKIDIKNVFHHLHAPISFTSKITEIEAVKNIQSLCGMQIQSEFTREMCALVIPSFITKEKILELVNGPA